MVNHDAAKDLSRVPRSARVRAAAPLFVSLLASIALAWLRPDLATFPIAGVCLAIPIALLLLALRPTPLRARWALGLVASFVALFGTAHVSNERANDGLDAIRVALLAEHVATGRYPSALVAPPEAGLPGTLRVFTYHADDQEPRVSYPTLGSHGWRVSMLVASGVRVAVP